MFDQVKLYLNPILMDLNVTLINMDSKSDKRGLKLLVTVDTEENVSLDQCAEISKRLTAILDDEDIIKSAYTIEVSSPGLTANLTHDLQFKKAIGKDLNISYLDNEGIDRTEDVRLESFENNTFKFIRKKDDLMIKKDQIKSAKLRLQW